jgi:hypothetical protein
MDLLSSTTRALFAPACDFAAGVGHWLHGMECAEVFAGRRLGEQQVPHGGIGSPTVLKSPARALPSSRRRLHVRSATRFPEWYLAADRSTSGIDQVGTVRRVNS